MQGHLDQITPFQIAGWAVTADNAPALLYIFVNDEPIDQILCDQHRPDLEGSGICPRAGFVYTFRIPLNRGDTVAVRFHDLTDITGSPHRLAILQYGDVRYLDFFRVHGVAFTREFTAARIQVNVDGVHHAEFLSDQYAADKRTPVYYHHFHKPLPLKSAIELRFADGDSFHCMPVVFDWKEFTFGSDVQASGPEAARLVAMIVRIVEGPRLAAHRRLALALFRCLEELVARSIPDSAEARTRLRLTVRRLNLTPLSPTANDLHEPLIMANTRASFDRLGERISMSPANLPQSVRQHLDQLRPVRVMRDMITFYSGSTRTRFPVDFIPLEIETIRARNATIIPNVCYPSLRPGEILMEGFNFSLSMDHWHSGHLLQGVGTLPGTYVFSKAMETVLTEGTSLLLEGSYSTSNFGHWLFDCVPRALVLGLVEPVPLILLARSVTPWHRFVLDLLLRRYGTRIAKIEEIAPDRVYCCEDVYVPTLFAREGPFTSLLAVAFLRDLFDTPSRSVNIGLRIYVSRGNSAHGDIPNNRYIRNEYALASLLVAHGFQIVQLEKLVPAEQIALFRGASHVVGLTGSGLNNLIFASPQVKALEIHNRRPKNYDFVRWGAALCDEYHFVDVQDDVLDLALVKRLLLTWDIT